MGLMRNVFGFCRRIILLAGPILVVLCATLSSPVLAHDEATDFYPVAGSSVESPGYVEIVFATPMEPSLVHITLESADGVTAELATPVNGEDSKSVRAQVVGELSPGLWSVSWGAVSQDGHPVSGSFSFTVIPSATSTTSVGVGVGAGVGTTAATTDTQPPSVGSSTKNGGSGETVPTWMLFLMAGLAVAGSVVAGSVAKRQR